MNMDVVMQLTHVKHMTRGQACINSGYVKGSCNIVGKPLCYHKINPSQICCGGDTVRSPNLPTLLGQLSLSSFRG